MTSPVISVEHLTKQYDLGVIGTGTLSRDLNRWWARVRHLPDPYTRIGQQDAFARLGESILALDDVSFTVQQGEALGIIGRNGAGKSTLLKILSRVTAPSSGVVKVRGRIGSLLEVGTGFHPELTGRENVYLNGAILGMKKAEVTRKFDEIVAFAGVEKFIDTPVKRYSSGMYVRLAFAVAAHLDPEILIVDEVLAVGDAEFQKKCLGKMGDVAGEGRTVLFVSHNMAAIQSLCETCLYIKNGQIDQIGETESIIEKYMLDSQSKQVHGSKQGSIIKEVRMLDGKGQSKTTFKTNDTITIQIFTDTGLEMISHPSVGIGVNNSSGLRLLTVGTYLTDKELPMLGGKNIVECAMGENQLVPGTYSLKIAIGSNEFENVEDIENAFQFTIEPSDYFGNGKLPSRHQGLFLYRSNWKVIDEH